MFRRWISLFLVMALPLSATIDKIPVMAPDSFGCHKQGFCYLTRDGVASERFPNGVSVTTVRSEDKITVSVGELGSVGYRFEAGQLMEILRKDTLGVVVYQSRLEYSPEGFLLSEGLIGGLGKMQHRLEDGLYSCITPALAETKCMSLK